MLNRERHPSNHVGLSCSVISFFFVIKSWSEGNKTKKFLQVQFPSCTTATIHKKSACVVSPTKFKISAVIYVEVYLVQ